MEMEPALYPAAVGMTLRDSHGVFEDLQARLEDVDGSGLRADGWYAPEIEHRARRRRALALAAIVAGVALAGGGSAIGTSQGTDVGAAEQAGIAAGEQRGTAVGTREGFASTFKPARDHAYGAAYREAYRTAYRDEFKQADLAVPRHLPVSGP